MLRTKANCPHRKYYTKILCKWCKFKRAILCDYNGFSVRPHWTPEREKEHDKFHAKHMKGLWNKYVAYRDAEPRTEKELDDFCCMNRFPDEDFDAQVARVARNRKAKERRDAKKICK